MIRVNTHIRSFGKSFSHTRNLQASRFGNDLLQASIDEALELLGPKDVEMIDEADRGRLPCIVVPGVSPAPSEDRSCYHQAWDLEVRSCPEIRRSSNQQYEAGWYGRSLDQ